MLINNYKALYRAKIFNSNDWIEGSLIVIDNENTFICPRFWYSTATVILRLIEKYAKLVDEKTICRSFMYCDDSGKLSTTKIS